MSDSANFPVRALTSFLTFRLSRTQNKLNAQGAYILRTHADLSLVEWRLIQMMRLHEGASMSKLSKEVQIDKGQLSRKVTQMVKKGLIDTTTNPEDHRIQNLTLTGKALALQERMMPIMMKRQEILVSGVTKEELETFYKVLTSIDDAAAYRDNEPSDAPDAQTPGT